MTMQRVEMPLGRYTLSLETGRMAKQSDGAVVVRLGDTVVLATANAQREPRVGMDFLPLTVDYRENNYAAGKIPGGFFKREGRPTEKEVLTSRMIDRPLRPLFPEGYTHETQVIGLLLSADLENDSDTLAITGASCALMLSEIPFTSAVAAVRVGYWDGQAVVNPTSTELRTRSKLNLLVAGTDDAIVMVEAGASEISEQVMVEALVTGHEAIRKIVALQRELQAKAGRPKWTFTPKQVDPGFLAWAEQEMAQPLLAAMQHPGKLESYARMKKVKDEFLARIPETEPEKRAMVSGAYEHLREKIMRREILQNHRRHDGRRFDEIRNITCEVGVLPRVHGSALFTRGETQALVTVTLGTSEDMQIIDTVQEPDHKKRFMLHYNFPPFSVGEVKFLRGPGRREIGHGALAERSLREALPDEETFPYTVRIVSDILESNGSSSMASICGGTLALLDAGVPLKGPVAGVAMGLVKEGDDYAILSDIAGVEDHYGDMDFKVAGTRNGLTALQMDIKIGGITQEILARALEQARAGRMHILDRMLEALPEARPTISTYAPRIITVKIPVDKIRDVIGPGGKMIRSIVERTGCKIDVEDDGRVSIASVDEGAARKAVAIIEELTATAELNKTYLGKVVRVVDFGAFVEIIPGTDGLLHVSELAHHRVQDVRSEVKEGDQILVKVVNIDPSGKIRLSRKALLEGGEAGTGEGGQGQGGQGEPQPAGAYAERRPQDRSHGDRGHRPDRDRGRGGDRGRDRRPR
ncbi:MAG TPA: polyribonucleotide nucleotidyltransferase [Vicinamibacteria bacterium]|nr:polyribonucleotide nucleotidyltransferase [Vicinamibacteria bacterium]